MTGFDATRFNAAILRRPATSVVSGLRAGDGQDPTYEGVAAEHAAYAAALEAAGVDVTLLPALEAFPDSIFVEDPALVFPAGAILLRPGAASRLGEVAEIAPTLRARFETVLEVTEGFADGGDVMSTAEKVMIGLSARTDRVGAECLVRRLADLGYRGEIVETPADVLHFKTASSPLEAETIFATRRLADTGVFKGFRTVIVPEGEEAAANALRVNDAMFVGSQFPKTIDLLDSLGYKVVPLSTVEIGRIDAGLSCMSLRWNAIAG